MDASVCEESLKKRQSAKLRCNLADWSITAESIKV